MSTSDSKLATRSDSFDEPPPPAPSLKHTVSEPVPKRAVLESEEDALRRMEGGLGPFPAAPAAPGPGLLRSASDDAALPRSPRSNSFASRRIWAQQRIPTLLRQASSNLANALPSLLARVTSIGDAAAGAVSVNEQFYCQICMCNEDRKEGYTLPCDHTFCRDCLAQYLTVKIKDAQVDLFKCPHVDDTEMSARGDGWHCSACTYFNAFADPPTERVTCGMCATEQDAPPREEPGCRLVIDDGDMENLLTAETRAKLARFQEIKGNKHYRECPRCQAPNTDGPTRLSNNLVCEKCGHNYCYVHSDQHVGRSCRQFEREHRAELKLAEAHIAQFTRPCPGCKRPIEKSSGCNHMTCPGCSTNFCWLCGRTIGGDTYPNHFAPWNVLGCPNMQMQDDLREGMTNREAACQACAWRLAYCPMGLCMIATIVTVMVVFGSISLAWFAVFSVICWCLCYAPAMACWRLFLVPCCKCDDDDLNLNNVEEIQSIFKYFPLLPCMAFMAILSPSD